MLSAKKISKIPLSHFTPCQVAEMLDVSSATVYNYMKRGVRVSNDIYIKLQKSPTDSRIHKHQLLDFVSSIKE